VPHSTQTWDAERYARNARFVAERGAEIASWLAPSPGERILDLGCGDGALTEALAALGADVVGVDASPNMVTAASARGLDARVMDGHVLSFENEFDAVFSNAALHWMTEPDAVIEAVARALKPCGRFVGEMGGKGNVDAVVDALADALAARGHDAMAASPWYFPDPDDYAARLRAGGFAVERITLVPRPTPIPGRLGDWLETLAETFLNLLPEGEKPELIDEIEDALAPHLRDADGVWHVDYARLRFAAQLTGESDP
jgi:trans-aconitate methyltransferase